MQIFSEQKQQDISVDYLQHTIEDERLDFNRAKDIAKKLAFQKCSQSMILSWKNGITG